MFVLVHQECECIDELVVVVLVSGLISLGRILE